MFSQRLLLVATALTFAGCGDANQDQADQGASKPIAKIPPPLASKSTPADDAPATTDYMPKPPAATKTTPPTSSNAPTAGEATKSTKDSENAPPKADSEGSKEGGAAAADPASIQLEKVDLDAYAKRIEGLKGKIVVVDGWATWCPQCLAKFPKFMELVQSHKGSDIVFVTLSADDEEDLAKKFLAKHASPATHNLLMTSSIDEVQERYAFTGLPQYFIYDREGKLAMKSDSFDDIAPKLKELTAKP